MAFIKIMSGERKGSRIDIDRDEIVIGRAPDNLVVLKDESVSGKHCAIIRNGRKFIIRDLGSTNGVLVNESPITEQQLKPKDKIMVGNVEILFDGDDIEITESPENNDSEKTEIKTDIDTSSSAIPNTIAFHKRKKKKWLAYLFWTLLAIFTIGALAYFGYMLIIQK